MKTCDNCGNEIRNKAIYCDICGNFLGINNKSVILKFCFQTTLERINNDKGKKRRNY